MARDRRKEAMMKYLANRIDKNLPYMYAAMCVALYRCLDGEEEQKIDDIITVIAESQAVWNECVESGRDMVEWCDELTGIDVRKSIE